MRNGSANGLPAASSVARKSAHSACHLAGVRIGDVADRLRQAADVVDRFLLQRRFVGLLHEDRVALDVGALAPLPRAAEPGQPVADVEQERVALLLAIVADVDAGLGLLRHDGGERRLAGRVQRGRIDRLAARAARIQPGQLDRPRQAAGMGGQDPLLASTHALPAAECRHFPASIIPARFRVKAKPVWRNADAPCAGVPRVAPNTACAWSPRPPPRTFPTR